MTENLPETPVYALPEVLTMLRMARSSFDQMRARGEAPKTFLIGRRRYILREDLEAWLKERAEASEEENAR